MTKRWRWLAAGGGLLWAFWAPAQSDWVPLGIRTVTLAVTYSEDGTTNTLKTLSLSGVTNIIYENWPTNWAYVDGANLHGCFTNLGAGGPGGGILGVGGDGVFVDVVAPSNVVLTTRGSNAMLRAEDASTNGHQHGFQEITNAPWLTTAATNAQGLAYFWQATPVDNWYWPAGSATVYYPVQFSNEVSDAYGVYNPVNGQITPQKGYFFIALVGQGYSFASGTYANFGVACNGDWKWFAGGFCGIPQGLNSIPVSWTFYGYNAAATNIWVVWSRDADTDSGIEYLVGQAANYTNTSMLTGGNLTCE